MRDNEVKQFRAWLLALGVYLSVTIALTWPLVFHLSDHAFGIQNVDGMDTAWLRLAVARLPWSEGPPGWTDQLFAPVGYPLYNLVPNWIDHISGAPFAWWIAWPLSDNLWWMLVLMCNGICGHFLGVQCSGSHKAGFLVGVAVACSEPVLREANFGHAPQAMVGFSLLHLGFLIQLLREPSRWGPVIGCSVCFSLACLTYWYQGLFLATISAPIIGFSLWYAQEKATRRRVISRLACCLGIATLLLLGPLSILLFFWEGLPQTGAGALPDLMLSDKTHLVPKEHRWTLGQSGDLLWPLRPTPLDRTNRMSITLLIALILGWRNIPKPLLLAGMFGVLLGSLMLMGPYLKWGEDPITIAGMALPLPWKFLSESTVFLGRFHWPPRWGLTVTLALACLVAFAPKPRILAAFVLLETILLSGNAPARMTPVAQFDGWRGLATSQGSILVLPLHRPGPRGPQLGFIYRAMQRPIAGQIPMPPGSRIPTEWYTWQTSSDFLQWFNGRNHREPIRQSLPSSAIQDLVDVGIDAIALDTTPGGLLPPARVQHYRQDLSLELGAPIDMGSALVWWISTDQPPPPPMHNAQEWRSTMDRKLQAAPRLKYRSLLRPVPMEPQQ